MVGYVYLVIIPRPEQADRMNSTLSNEPSNVYHGFSQNKDFGVDALCLSMAAFEIRRNSEPSWWGARGANSDTDTMPRKRAGSKTLSLKRRVRGCHLSVAHCIIHFMTLDHTSSKENGPPVSAVNTISTREQDFP